MRRDRKAPIAPVGVSLYPFPDAAKLSVRALSCFEQRPELFTLYAISFQYKICTVDLQRASIHSVQL